MITSPAERIRALALNAFRIVFGLMFMQHGAQKMFGIFTDQDPVSLTSLLGVAGVLEFWGGLLIVVGLLTRTVAFVLAGQMAIAYFRQHFPGGPVPIMNRGELAILYCFAFAYMAAHGGGAFSVDGLIDRRRTRAS
ncbi:MAG: DoxX family protein [Gemmatimonadetes bacterium]|nr:DoxX family protein [Gemmatimonadota bacterium]